MKNSLDTFETVQNTGIGIDVISGALSQYYKDREDVHIVYGHNSVNTDTAIASLAAHILRVYGEKPSLKYIGLSFAISTIHQIAVVIDMESKLIYYKDSLHGSTLPKLQVLANSLSQLSNTDSYRIGKLIYEGPYTDQEHMWECGIYTFYNLTYIIDQTSTTDRPSIDKPERIADLSDLEARYNDIQALSDEFVKSYAPVYNDTREKRRIKLLLRDALSGLPENTAPALLAALRLELSPDSPDEIRERCICDFLQSYKTNHDDRGNQIVHAYIEFLKGSHGLGKCAQGMLVASDSNCAIVQGFLNTILPSLVEVKVDETLSDAKVLPAYKKKDGHDTLEHRKNRKTPVTPNDMGFTIVGPCIIVGALIGALAGYTLKNSSNIGAFRLLSSCFSSSEITPRIITNAIIGGFVGLIAGGLASSRSI